MKKSDDWIFMKYFIIISIPFTKGVESFCEMTGKIDNMTLRLIHVVSLFLLYYILRKMCMESKKEV